MAGSFTACNKVITESSGASFASDFSFETSDAAVTESTVATSEVIEAYKTACIYFDGDLIATRLYDVNNNMVEEKRLGDNGFTNKFQYDAAGNLIAEMKFGNDSLSQGGNVYGYDAAGNMVKKIYVNPDGSYGNQHVYEYDASGFMIKDTEYDAAGNKTQWLVFENDDHGNHTKQTHNDNSGDTYEIRYEYEYDAAGNITKSTTYRGGELSDWSEFTFYAAGNSNMSTTLQAT